MITEGYSSEDRYHFLPVRPRGSRLPRLGMGKLRAEANCCFVRTRSRT